MPTLRTGELKVRYDERGSGPPLLLLGGLGLPIESWAPQIAALSAEFRVIALDQRGAGGSDAPEPPYTTAEMARDALGVLDALGVDRAHVVGLSMGGLVAQEMALGAPGRVASLVLAATAARLPARTRHVLDLWGRMVRARVEPELLVREQLAWVLGEESLAVDAVRAGWIAALLGAPPPSPAGFAGQLAACLAHDASERLGAVRSPALVLVGRDDRLLPVAASEDLARRIPGARLQVLDGGGHAFAAEIAGGFDDAVLGFLREAARGTAEADGAQM